MLNRRDELGTVGRGLRHELVDSLAAVIYPLALVAVQDLMDDLDVVSIA
jgi:hypothetical protein